MGSLTYANRDGRRTRENDPHQAHGGQVPSKFTCFITQSTNGVAYPVRIVYDNPWMVSVMMVIVIRVMLVVMAGPSNHE